MSSLDLANSQNSVQAPATNEPVSDHDNSSLNLSDALLEGFVHVAATPTPSHLHRKEGHQDILYLAAHKLVICVLCQSCVESLAKGLLRHLRLHFKGPELQRLFGWLATLQINSPQQVVFPPGQPIEALPHLPIIQAFECQHCHVVKVAVSSKTNYILSVHDGFLRDHPDCSPSANSHWTPVEAQSLTKTSQRIYFTVYRVGQSNPGLEIDAAIVAL